MILSERQKFDVIELFEGFGFNICIIIFSVMEVTVVDTTGAVKDVVFPDPTKLEGTKWAKNSDQIKFSSATVKELSVEGKSS